jgi:RHS repeat-associated protein
MERSGDALESETPGRQGGTVQIRRSRTTDRKAVRQRIYPLGMGRQHAAARMEGDMAQGREFWDITKQPLVTWVFESGTFVPAAKITEKQQISIVTNYMGTPEAMYREDGEAVWMCELNSYGRVRNFQGESKTMCPFRYQGQYEDAETGQYYNRFRYYSPEEGMFISQDPIGLNGGMQLYNYVHDPNSWIDRFGLAANRGRIQAQGTHLEKSVSWVKLHHLLYQKGCLWLMN